MNLTSTAQFNIDFDAFGMDEADQSSTAAATKNQVTSVTLDAILGKTNISDLAVARSTSLPAAEVVSEPATMVFFGASMATLGFLGSRKKRTG